MKKLIIFIMIFAIVLPLKVQAEDTETVELSNCVDGNSARFMLGLGEIKVKFLGIEVEEKIIDDETDEINESLVSDYVCSVLTQAQKITIEYDPKAVKEDKYGRLQVWVFVDDILLQEDLVNLGYARIMYLDDDYLYADKLKTAQKNAREKNLGIWKNVVPEIEEEEEVVEEEKSKGILETIFDFFKSIFNAILSFIDGIINNIL